LKILLCWPVMSLDW